MYFFTRQNVRARKAGCTLDVLLAKARPIGIGRAISPDLFRLEQSSWP